MEAVFLLGVGYTRDTTTAITCLTIAVGVSGFAISGKYVYRISNKMYCSHYKNYKKINRKTCAKKESKNITKFKGIVANRFNLT